MAACFANDLAKKWPGEPNIRRAKGRCKAGGKVPAATSYMSAAGTLFNTTIVHVLLATR
jgi:hypothetical protein